MSKISIIVPFRDELEFIDEAYKWTRIFLRSDLEIIWVNDGSKDGGERRLEKLITASEIIVHTKGVGILSAFFEGSKFARGEILIFLPIDCNLLSLDYEVLEKVLILEGRAWGAFEKSYDSRMMDFYARLQNNVLLKSGIVVWTNVFVVPKILLEDIPSDLAFPQDLRLSKLLRKKAEFLILPGKVKVSARKYVRDGRVVRIIQNALILLFYLLGIEGRHLEKFYRKAGMGKLLAKGFLFFLLLLICVRLIASTTQRQPVKRSHGSTTQKRLPPRNNVGTSSSGKKSFAYVPVTRSQEEVEKWIYTLPRKNVSIHTVQKIGNEIRIEGTFTNLESLDVFSKSLTGDGKREMKMETKTYYKMGVNKDYFILLENEW